MVGLHRRFEESMQSMLFCGQRDQFDQDSKGNDIVMSLFENFQLRYAVTS